MPKVSLIVAALLPTYGIGCKGKLPWRLKQDMKFFRLVTTSTHDSAKRNMVIMGRKTYDSIPPKFRPLKNRVNVILTRSVENYEKDHHAEISSHSDNLKVAGSLKQALKLSEETSNIEEIFIIGGAQLYNSIMEEASNLIDRIFLTEVTCTRPVEMDTFLQWESKDWNKQPEGELIKYLEWKKLEGKFQLNGNEEGDYKYNFSMWKS